VCKACSSFGQIIPEKKPAPQVVLPQEKEEYELVDGYGEMIKKAREKMNLTRKELAIKMKVKENILKRIEAEELVPEEDLAKRIEKELGVKILQKVESSSPKKEFKQAKLTIGDVAKIE
jgi:putative transcription factor